MARFDLRTHPDRFALEALGRQVRAEELARLGAALRGWIAREIDALRGGFQHPLAPGRANRLHH